MTPDSDRERWDARWSERAGRPPASPDPFIVEAVSGLDPGSALDLACGDGRHALWLARLGWRVEAWDVSPVGLEALRAHARERELEIATRVVDLSAPLPSAASFDLVVVCDFLERSLHARLAELVAPRGLAVVTTFAHDFAGAHPSPRFRLEPGELARGLPGLSTELVRERDGRSGIVARR